jgi:excisionase family DNA binding protein
MLAFGNASEEQTGTSGPSGRRAWDRSPTPQRATPSAADAGGRWLSIDAACKILGVDKSTLRRWSDRGRIPVFRTPGGHRRYSEDDLRAFLAGEIGSSRPISRRELTALTREEFQRICLEDAVERDWFRACATEWRRDMRPICHQMLDLSVRYASGRGNRERILADGCELAREYGKHMARADFSASEAVDAFLLFRRPLFDALSRYIEQENLTARRSWRMLEALTVYLDAALKSTIEAHEATSAR